MEAKELRIGNLFRFISTNYIEYVSEIKTNGLKTAIINNVSIKDTEPIPLTEEWLVKFGFEKLEGWDDMFYFQISGFQIYEYNVSGYEYDGFNIKYLHQLQNLYFALTNEELTIKQ